MRYSNLFGKTNKNAPHDADSANAKYLVQAGFVNQLAAGIYTYLPLGYRVLTKIQQIVREEMNAIGGQEVYMPALHPREPWEATGRWDEIDVMFHLKGHSDKDYALGSTHEEIITPIVKQFAHSYKDFPIFVYQIQDKFRNEARAKSGLLRGREFSMKDLYSFHLSEENRAEFYEKVADAYRKVFKRCGIKAIYTEASGGTFGDASHEFQTPTESGEDIIFYCESCDYAWNKEVSQVKDGDLCPKCEGIVKEMKAIEVGNIFPLGTKFSEAVGFTMQDENGTEQAVIMGSYGIGPSRVMGAIVEVSHDERGMIWPKTVAPYHVHLVTVNTKDETRQQRIVDEAESLHDDLTQAGVEVLWDDRGNKSPGEKFADADLIGIPLRIVISEKTLAEDSIEWKERYEKDAKLVKLIDAKEEIQSYVNEPYETTSH